MNKAIGKEIYQYYSVREGIDLSPHPGEETWAYVYRVENKLGAHYRRQRWRRSEQRKKLERARKHD